MTATGPNRAREIAELWTAITSGALPAEGPCMEWPGSKNGKGYGSTKRHGVNVASRAVWVAVYGPIEDATQRVLHRCDNPPCVRPGHLFLGTAATNTADMMAKGRHVAPHGERNGRSTITDSTVVELRERHAGGASYKQLGREYRLHPVTVSRICRGLLRARPTNYPAPG